MDYPQFLLAIETDNTPPLNMTKIDYTWGSAHTAALDMKPLFVLQEHTSIPQQPTNNNLSLIDALRHRVKLP